jgi:hypothetical protein
MSVASPGRFHPLRLARLATGLLSLAAHAETIPDGRSHLELAGTVFLEPVDARRILVAVATQPGGAADEVFLYTAIRPLRDIPRLRDVSASLVYDADHGLRIVPTAPGGQVIEFVVGAAPAGRTLGAIRFTLTAGLAHYRAQPPLQASELRSLSHRADCDVTPRACIQVAGQFLPFPD